MDRSERPTKQAVRTFLERYLDPETMSYRVAGTSPQQAMNDIAAALTKDREKKLERALEALGWLPPAKVKLLRDMLTDDVLSQILAVLKPQDGQYVIEWATPHGRSHAYITATCIDEAEQMAKSLAIVAMGEDAADWTVTPASDFSRETPPNTDASDT